MRKVIAWNLMSLDGFFEGRTRWELDWHEYAWGEELEKLSLKQLGSAGALLFGRSTYLGMAAYWPTATEDVADLMNSIEKLVFSKTLEKAEWNNTRLVRTDAAAEVSALKRQPGRDMFIFGSAELCASLAGAGLIDEYRVCIVPVLLGGGKPLFKPDERRRRLELLEARALKSGGVILRYKPA
jgi:dihydrofolate reductase